MGRPQADLSSYNQVTEADDIHQQPPPPPPPPPYEVFNVETHHQESSGLFDCLDDPENALVTACFPCVTFGQIAEIVDSGTTSCVTSGILYGLVAFLIGLPFLISCSYRTKLRTRFGLLESPASDWLTHCFCEWCALCQEYRELKRRGFDPSICWHGNLAMIQQQQQQVVLMPPTNRTMIA